MSVAAEPTEPVAILGAGSLGRLWAAYLPAGQACFLSRPTAPSPPSDEASHYRLKSPEDQASQIRVPYRAAWQTQPELLMVTTKAGDTIAALEATLPAINAHVPVILFQNGMGLQSEVATRWPERPILAASTTEGANRPDAETLQHAGRGQTWIGGMNAKGAHCVDAVIARLTSSGLSIVAEPDIHQRLWNKLVVNAGINPFTALLDCRNGEILNQPFFLEQIESLCGEIGQVMAYDTTRPLTAAEILDQIKRVATSTANNTSSMRSDVQRGRPTEIDVINGYIVDCGTRAGIATPVNQTLVHQVKELSKIN